MRDIDHCECTHCDGCPAGINPQTTGIPQGTRRCTCLAGGVRALLDAPAEAPLRGEVHAAPHVRPYRADPAGRWEVNATVLSPTREDAERVAAALRAVLARLT